MTKQFTFNQAIDELADITSKIEATQKKHTPQEKFDGMEAFENGLYEAVESNKLTEHVIPKSIPATF